jgi:predicted anti-sigma-YlaC factor YlaD
MDVTEKTEPMRLKPTCREVHRLVSEGLDRNLTLIERTRVRLHLMVCHACTNFSAQMSLIRQAMRRLGAEDDALLDGEPK